MEGDGGKHAPVLQRDKKPSAHSVKFYFISGCIVFLVFTFQLNFTVK